MVFLHACLYIPFESFDQRKLGYTVKLKLLLGYFPYLPDGLIILNDGTHQYLIKSKCFCCSH